MPDFWAPPQSQLQSGHEVLARPYEPTGLGFRYLCSYLGEFCRASMGQDMHDGSLGHASTIETEP